MTSEVNVVFRSLSLSNPALIIAVLSLVVSIIAITISYLQYKAPTHSDRFEREQMMRERFDRIPKRRDLPHNLEVVLSEPRIRNKGFTAWVQSLVPTANPPWYTHFNARVYYPDEEYTGFYPADSDSDYSEPPTPEELQEHKALKSLGVFNVEYEDGPRTNKDGTIVINPTSDFRVYVNSVEPDKVGNVMEIFRGVVEEIITDENVVIKKE